MRQSVRVARDRQDQMDHTAGSDALGLQGAAHTPTTPPFHQAEPGALPDHLPAHVQDWPSLLGILETLGYKALHAGLLTFHTDVMGGINHGLLRLEAIQRTLTADQAQDYETVLDVSTAPQPLDYYGKRHLLLWTNASVTGLVMSAHGLSRTMNLAAGWNVIDPPRGASIAAASGTVLLILRATDHVASSYA